MGGGYFNMGKKSSGNNGAKGYMNKQAVLNGFKTGFHHPFHKVPYIFFMIT